jgi:hypothetical protein
MANVNPLKVFQIQNDLAKVVLQKFEANDMQFFNELKELVQKHSIPISIGIDNEFHAETRIEWQEFYQKCFGIEVEFRFVQIPTKPTVGKWRLLFIAKDLTLNQVFNAWTFPKWRVSEDLDAYFPTHSRLPTEHYAVWVQDSIEPDAIHRGKSTRKVDPDMKIGITVLERMIFESKYFDETGNHLDVKGLTFCSGSRSADGHVASVDLLSDGEVYVFWSDLDSSNSNYGVRSAVPLVP